MVKRAIPPVSVSRFHCPAFAVTTVARPACKQRDHDESKEQNMSRHFARYALYALALLTLIDMRRQIRTHKGERKSKQAAVMTWEGEGGTLPDA